jgi:hypothetical protein
METEGERWASRRELIPGVIQRISLEVKGEFELLRAQTSL